MSFKDGQISSQKVNLQLTLPPAGNGGQATCRQSERRIVSGDPPHGEFEAAHCRTANYQLYIYLTLITSAFSYFCSEETSKGCAVRHSPYIVVTPVTNIQKGEFEAGHTRPPRKSPLYLRGWYKGLSFGL